MRPDLLPITIEGKLDHIIEEAGEVIKAYIKRKRFGSLATDPFTGTKYDNDADLRNEILDLRNAIAAYLKVA
jgi:hypothetical protein